jgi:hypothetical protein
MVVEVEKKFFVLENFSTPRGVIDALQLFEALPQKVQSRPVDVFVTQLPAEGGFLRQGASMHPQHRHGIAPDFTEGARCGGGHFGTHRCAKINSRAPIEGLIDQDKEQMNVPSSTRATSLGSDFA